VIDPANRKREVQSGCSANRVRMPRVMHPCRKDASGISRSRHSHARAHVLKAPRLFQQDDRTRRRLQKQLSHVDLGALGDTHNTSPRRVRSQDRKDFRRDDLKLRAEVSLHLGSEDYG
jgi:hypothetical protein